MKAIDLTGKRFGKLVVLHRQGYHVTKGGFKRILWLCQCDCGKQKIVLGRDLKRGHTNSCGCNYLNNGWHGRDSTQGFNDFREENNTLFIKVGDKEVIIDKEDLLKFYPYRLTINSKGYVFCGKQRRLHRLIVDCPKNMEVDHINHNTLDNRKCNLRIVTRAENQLNKEIRGKTGEFGISFSDRDKTYRVVIDGKYRGCAKTLEESIEIRNEALKGTRQLQFNYYLSVPGAGRKGVHIDQSRGEMQEV